MSLQKTKRVRLKGKALRDLNNAIFDRDCDKCVICGRWVSRQEKFHHEPAGALKSDEIDKGVVLCMDCHRQRHHTEGCNVIKAKVINYLKSIYRLQKPIALILFTSMFVI